MHMPTAEQIEQIKLLEQASTRELLEKLRGLGQGLGQDEMRRTK